MNGKMMCLSLWRPWPWFIRERLKTIETRKWFALPKYMVGKRLAIHAAVKLDSAGVGLCAAKRRGGLAIPPCDEMPTGIICHVLVEKVRWGKGFVDSDAAMCWAEKLACIFLTDVVVLDPPVAYRGHKGLFYVPESLILAPSVPSV